MNEDQSTARRQLFYLENEIPDSSIEFIAGQLAELVDQNRLWLLANRSRRKDKSGKRDQENCSYHLIGMTFTSKNNPALVPVCTSLKPSSRKDHFIVVIVRLSTACTSCTSVPVMLHTLFRVPTCPRLFWDTVITDNKHLDRVSCIVASFILRKDPGAT